MRTVGVFVAAIVGCWATAGLACESPAIVPIPDGKTATMDQLLAAQAQVKSYMAAMQTYLACIDMEADAKGADAPAEYKSMMIDRHNTAVSEMEQIAAAFNEQVKAYKAANPTPPKN
jgi:hypothetical protein